MRRATRCEHRARCGHCAVNHEATFGEGALAQVAEEGRVRILWVSLLLGACGQSSTEAQAERVEMTEREKSPHAASALDDYLACAKAEAARFGTPDVVSEEQAIQVVSECDDLLQEAASERVALMQGRRMTNLPEGTETEQSRIAVARGSIEHEAKMAVSHAVLQRPVP